MPEATHSSKEITAMLRDWSEQRRDEILDAILLGEIAIERQAEWHKLNPVRAKQFQAHAEKLLENTASGCPPGFQEVDGICVRI